jgi:uncharacterized membrane protein
MTRRRIFPASVLDQIEGLVKESERKHAGEICVAVEAYLPIGRVLRGLMARDRALEVFSDLQVWDTEGNCGVLLYLLLSERQIEIVADRGISRVVNQESWEDICRNIECEFQQDRYLSGIRSGIQAVTELLVRHFPLRSDDLNERGDRPTVL